MSALLFVTLGMWLALFLSWAGRKVRPKEINTTPGICQCSHARSFHRRGLNGCEERVYKGAGKFGDGIIESCGCTLYIEDYQKSIAA